MGSGGRSQRDPVAVSRRRFLGGAGAVGSAIVAGGLAAAGTSGAAAPAASTAAALSGAERDLVLEVARAGARVPIAFPDFGEPGPATARATAARLRDAESRLRDERLALVKAGTGDLVERGLGGAGRQELVDGLAGHAAEATRDQEVALVAVVALAVATVSRHFDPNADSAARVWVGGLRRAHQRGDRLGGVRHLEER